MYKQYTGVRRIPHVNVIFFLYADIEKLFSLVGDVSDPGPIDSAIAVMETHIQALNARDEAALAATLHFPHYRLAGGVLKVWKSSDQYFADFRARAGGDWHHSRWESLDVIAADETKVHLDVTFTRHAADESLIGRFRSLWIISKLNGVWAAHFRSTFAP